MAKHRVCVTVDTGEVQARASAEAVAEAASTISGQVQGLLEAAVKAALRAKAAAGGSVRPPSVEVTAFEVS